MFKRTIDLTEGDKRMIEEMYGKVTVWIMEGRSLDYISKQLKLSPTEVMANNYEAIYLLSRQVGWRRHLKALFRK